ncbi:MAG: 2-C-methyl-D-erythritol 4-phosphate cytidylyltransferase [Lapillicoccus sp.]
MSPSSGTSTSTDPLPASGRGSVAVVVVAAGAGTRFGAEVPKAFVTLADRTLLAWSLDAASACPGVVQVVVVAPEAYLEVARHETAYAGRPVEILVVSGGDERRDSVAAGLAAVTEGVDVVLVHDAARALAPLALFATVAAAVSDAYAAVVPGLPVVDTVKTVDAHGIVTGTPDRSSLRAIQTPQGFRRDVLVRAHAAPGLRGVTDDAALVEALGEPVLVVPGDPLAHKITTRDDLSRAEDTVRARGGHP